MNSSFRQLSFNSPNSSNLNIQLAESTKIGGSPFTSNSNDSFRGTQKRKPTSPLSHMNQYRQPPFRIEPHIFTNAQSNGLVKRLVTYYSDESQSEGDKNRYVYNKVGDFPIVQLKKNEIKRNLVRSSSVRIAPPSKTVLNRDIRAAILRSNSFQMTQSVPKLLPTRMRTKDELHQIITNHDPLPNDESSQASKSVLDALEKNCRKRINNEELTLDRTKRICATTSSEEVDTPQPPRESAPGQSAKRTREQLSPNQKSVPDSPSSQLRKKLRTKNNALLSSLSSSHYVLKPLKPLSYPPSVTSKIVPTPSNDVMFVPIQEKPVENISDKVNVELSSVNKESARVEPSSAVKGAKRLLLFNRKFETLPILRRDKKIVESDDDDDDNRQKINFVKPRSETLNNDIDIVRHIEKEKLSIMLSGLSEGFETPNLSPTKETVEVDAVDSNPLKSSSVVSLTSATPPALISFTTSTTSSITAPIVTFGLSSSKGLSQTLETSKTIPSIPPVTSATEEKKIEETILPTTKPSETSAITSIAPKPLVSFQFGTKNETVSATTTVVASISNPTIITPVVNNPTPLTTIDSNKSLISFSPAPKVPESSTIVSTSNIINAATVKTPTFGSISSGFSFGAQKSTTSALESNAVTKESVVSSITPTTSSFIFSSSTAPTLTFGSAAATAITTSAKTFGSSVSDVSSIVNNNKPNLTSTVSFMQQPETTTASGIGFSFKNTATMPATTTATSTKFTFGASSTMSSGNNAPLAAAAPSFKFGSSATPFEHSTVAQGFPNNVLKPVESQFSFGQKASIPTIAATTSAFSFGSGGSLTNTQSQMASQSTPSFNFDQSVTGAPASSGGIFSKLGEKPKETQPTFNFGGGSQSQQQSQSAIPSLFGNNSNLTSSASSTSVPLFGSTPNNSVFNNNQPSINSNNSIFGSNQSTEFGAPKLQAQSNNMFPFGSTPNNNNNQQQSQNSSTGIFSFDKSSSQNPATVANVFGGGNNSKNVSASFTFKPSTGTVSSKSSSSASSVFGKNSGISSGSAPPAYQFGSQNASNVSASFTFGGSSSNNNNQNAANQANSFNFNGPQSVSALSSVNSFNFQAAQPSLTPQPQLAGGLFSIGTGGNQQQRRPIRTATRRMK